MVVLKLVSNKPKSIRYQDDVLNFLNKFEKAIDNSGLSIQHSRTDIVHMIIRYAAQSNHGLFLMLLDNLEDESDITAYTVRGVVRSITQEDLKESDFNAALSSLV